MNRPQTRLIAGHARLPQGMAAQHMFESLTITAEIDVRYAVVIDASCTLVTEHSRAFIRDLLRGHSLRDDVGSLVELIQHCYVGRAGLALVAALKDLHLQYEKAPFEPGAGRPHASDPPRAARRAGIVPNRKAGRAVHLAPRMLARASAVQVFLSQLAVSCHMRPIGAGWQ